MRLHAFGAALVGLQQGLFQRILRAVRAQQARPMQQAMGVKGVVHAAPATGVEGEADLGAALANVLAHLRLLLGRGAVLFGNVLGQVLATGGHVGIELKGLEMQLGTHIWRQALKRAFQGAQAHSAPGASNVGHKINFEGGGHGAIPCKE